MSDEFRVHVRVIGNERESSEARTVVKISMKESLDVVVAKIVRKTKAPQLSEGQIWRLKLEEDSGELLNIADTEDMSNKDRVVLMPDADDNSNDTADTKASAMDIKSEPTLGATEDKNTAINHVDQEMIVIKVEPEEQSMLEPEGYAEEAFSSDSGSINGPNEAADSFSQKSASEAGTKRKRGKSDFETYGSAEANSKKSATLEEAEYVWQSTDGPFFVANREVRVKRKFFVKHTDGLEYLVTIAKYPIQKEVDDNEMVDDYSRCAVDWEGFEKKEEKDQVECTSLLLRNAEREKKWKRTKQIIDRHQKEEKKRKKQLEKERRQARKTELQKQKKAKQLKEKQLEEELYDRFGPKTNLEHLTSWELREQGAYKRVEEYSRIEYFAIDRETPEMIAQKFQADLDRLIYDNKGPSMKGRLLKTSQLEGNTCIVLPLFLSESE